MEKELLGQLNRFVKKTKAKIIPYACARPKDVFDDYFARKSPFGDGKQKSEFPDAFSLAAARAWAKKHKKILYVVSGDKAVREACDNNILLPLERLSDFLDLLAKEEARANAVYSAISTQFDADAAPQIEKAFERWGFGLEDRDGDVEDVEVASIHLEDIDILKLEHSRAEVELWANVEFTAVATYADLDNAAWDSEEKKFMFWETLTENIEDEKRLKVLATVVLDDPNNPTSIDFENIEIDARDTFWLQLAEDKTNYK